MINAETIAYNQGLTDAGQVVTNKGIELVGDGAIPDSVPFSTLSDIADAIGGLQKPLATAPAD